MLRRRAKAPYSGRTDSRGYAAYIDFYALAEKAYDELSDQNLERLEFFAAGINTYRAELRLLPREFYTHGLGGVFEEWHPIDSLAILKYTHFQLSADAIETKLLRYDLLMSDLDPSMVDTIAPLANAVTNKQEEPWAFKLYDSVIPEGQPANWIP